MNFCLNSQPIKFPFSLFFYKSLAEQPVNCTFRIKIKRKLKWETLLTIKKDFDNGIKDCYKIFHQFDSLPKAQVLLCKTSCKQPSVVPQTLLPFSPFAPPLGEVRSDPFSSLVERRGLKGVLSCCSLLQQPKATKELGCSLMESCFAYPLKVVRDGGVKEVCNQKILQEVLQKGATSFSLRTVTGGVSTSSIQPSSLVLKLCRRRTEQNFVLKVLSGIIKLTHFNQTLPFLNNIFLKEIKTLKNNNKVCGTTEGCLHEVLLKNQFFKIYNRSKISDFNKFRNVFFKSIIFLKIPWKLFLPLGNFVWNNQRLLTLFLTPSLFKKNNQRLFFKSNNLWLLLLGTGVSRGMGKRRQNEVSLQLISLVIKSPIIDLETFLVLNPFLESSESEYSFAPPLLKEKGGVKMKKLKIIKRLSHIRLCVGLHDKVFQRKGIKTIKTKLESCQNNLSCFDFLIPPLTKFLPSLSDSIFAKQNIVSLTPPPRGGTTKSYKKESCFLVFPRIPIPLLVATLCFFPY